MLYQLNTSNKLIKVSATTNHMRKSYTLTYLINTINGILSRYQYLDTISLE
ncbi:hypothetical protein N894_1210 [Francisella tularensis subsp. novicida PA10-7858]|nr:hypothetical protein N894_1210 [Francisella tularensis subsp. novicida PA10-7858]